MSLFFAALMALANFVWPNVGPFPDDLFSHVTMRRGQPVAFNQIPRFTERARPMLVFEGQAAGFVSRLTNKDYRFKLGVRKIAIPSVSCPNVKYLDISRDNHIWQWVGPHFNFTVPWRIDGGEFLNNVINRKIHFNVLAYPLADVFDLTLKSAKALSQLSLLYYIDLKPTPILDLQSHFGQFILCNHRPGCVTGLFDRLAGKDDLLVKQDRPNAGDKKRDSAPQRTEHTPPSSLLLGSQILLSAGCFFGGLYLFLDTLSKVTALATRALVNRGLLSGLCMLVGSGAALYVLATL